METILQRIARLRSEIKKEESKQTIDESEYLWKLSRILKLYKQIDRLQQEYIEQLKQ
jgi:hypothetical protein